MKDFFEAYIRALPKAELHLHLEGAVTPAILWSLSNKYATEYRHLTTEWVRQRVFHFQNFYDFLASYKIICEHLREPEDYLVVLESLKEYFFTQNILYAEITYTPAIPWKFERSGRAILEALLDRSREIEIQQGVRIKWILDCVRQFGKESAQRTARLAQHFLGQGVVGLGLGGDENALAMEEYEEVFAWAKANQLHVQIHAGEIGDPEQVWNALRVLGANRIAHGIQAARDPGLMDYLRDHAIGLDVCLTSNAKTRAWAPISKNPFWLLYRRGVPVTLNTDDPGLFETSLVEEYRHAARLFELTQEDIRHLALQGVRSSFLSHGEKMALMQTFHDKIRTLLGSLLPQSG